MNELDGVLHIERKFPFLFTAAPHCTTYITCTAQSNNIKSLLVHVHVHMCMYKINKIHEGTLVVSLVFVFCLWSLVSLCKQNVK